MIDEIMNHPDLFGIRRGECSENGISVQFCDDLIRNGELRDDSIVVLKPDEYYSSSRMHNPPPATDCLIIMKCGEEYKITLVELREVSSARGVKPSEIEPKFKTVIERFMADEFADIFMSQQYRIASFETILVTDPYRLRGVNQTTYEQKIRGSVIESYLLRKPLVFRGHASLIKVKLPDPVLCC